MDNPLAVRHNKRPKNNEGGSKTRVQRGSNRLGVKYKRRPTPYRLDDTKNPTSNSYCSPKEINKSEGCSISDEYIFKNSQKFFEIVLAKSTKNERVDSFSRRSSSFTTKISAKKSSAATKAHKRRSMKVSQGEFERDTREQRKRKKKSSIARTRKSSSKVPRKPEKGFLNIPNDFRLSLDSLNYIQDAINSCVDKAKPDMIRKEGKLLAMFHTILNLTRYSHHVEEFVHIEQNVLYALNKFYKSPKVSWYGCMILEKVLFDENRNGIYSRIEDVVINVMKEHKDLSSVQNAAFRLLWSISERKDLSARLFKKDSVRCVLGAIDRYPDNEDIQYAGCYLIQRLTVDNKNEDLFGRAGAIRLVIAAALNKKLNPDRDIGKKACSALWNLSFTDKNKERMLKSETDKKIEKIININMQIDRPDIVGKACGVLWNLADFADAKKEMNNNNIPQLVVETMKKFRFDDKIQENGCGCLRALAFDDQTRIGLMQIGASKKILQSMKDHLHNPGIQYQAFAVLKKLSCNDTNEGRLIKMEAGERILDAMEAHLEEPSIQERACGVLWNLAVNDDHKVKLVSIGCAEKMLKAMETHEDNEPVQFQTCRTLKRLARDSNNEVHLMRHGAAMHVLKAMRNHPKSERIQEKGCGVLWNLSERDEHKRELMNLNAADQILVSMQTHIDVDNVQYEACGALKRLAVDDEIERKLMEMDAASYVIRAMKRHVTVADVQGQACGVLWNLAFNGQAELMKLNAADQILIAMDNHKTNESVQEKACGTLWKLAEVGDNNEELIKLGVIQKVLDAMDNIKTHAGVQYQACGTLWNIAVQERNRKALLMHRAEERVLTVMKHHRNRADILHSACGVLFNLAQGHISLEKICSSVGNDMGKLESYKMVQQMNASLGFLGHSKERVATVSNRLLLASKGAITRLIQCVRAHPNNFDVFFQAITALNHISHDSRTIIFYLDEPALLNEIVAASSLHVEEQGVAEHVAMLYMKLMQGIYTLSKQSAFSQKLNDSSREVEVFVRDATLRMLEIARVNSLNPEFQTRTTHFFFAAFNFVAQKDVTLHTQLSERLVQPLKQPKEIKRMDSGTSSFYSRSSSFFGQTRTSFFEENLRSMRQGPSELGKDNVIFSKRTISRLVQRLATLIGNNNAEEKTVLIALKLVEKMLKDAAKFSDNDFFSTFQEMVIKNPLLLTNAINIFEAENKIKLHQKALWVIRLVLQFGTQTSVDSLLNRNFLSLAFNRLNYSQGKSYKYKILLVVTINMLVSKLETGKSIDQYVNAAEVCAAISDVLGSACSAAYAGIGDTLNTIKAICGLLSLPGKAFQNVFVEFVTSNRIGVLVDVFKVAESNIKRFHVALNVLDVLLTMTRSQAVNELLLSSEYFSDLLERVYNLHRLVLRHSYAYYGIKRTKTTQTRNTKISSRKRQKKSSRKVAAKPSLKSLGRAIKENLDVVDPRVVPLVSEKICGFYQQLGCENEKLAGILLENDEVYKQLKFVSALYLNGQNTKALSELAKKTIKDLFSAAPEDIKKLRLSENDSLTVSI